MTPVCGFFFSRQILSAQPVGSTHTVELADTHRDPEAFSHEVLDLAAGGIRVALAVIQHQGEHFPTQFDRVTMAPLDQSVLAFTLDSLEQPICSGTMHRNGAVPSRLCGRRPKLHLSNKLKPR